MIFIIKRRPTKLMLLSESRDLICQVAQGVAKRCNRGVEVRQKVKTHEIYGVLEKFIFQIRAQSYRAKNS